MPNRPLRLLVPVLALLLTFSAMALSQSAPAYAHDPTAHSQFAASAADTLSFSGYQWRVRSGGGGPGPNTWDPNNVFVDDNGYLHLKISYNGSVWTSAELESVKRLGFGTYQFQVIGAIDQLDRNVVLGLFNYPPPKIGPDGTNEIDIEFAQWGDSNNRRGNYTVWSPKVGVHQKSRTFDFALDGTYTTQRFTWSSRSILFTSLNGHRNNNRYEFGHWLYQPADYTNHIPQKPIPVHMNLWLFGGNAPTDGKPVEIIISSFKFTPQ